LLFALCLNNTIINALNFVFKKCIMSLTIMQLFG